MLQALAGDLDQAGQENLCSRLSHDPEAGARFSRLQTLLHRPELEDFVIPDDFKDSVMTSIESLPEPEPKFIHVLGRVFSLPSTPMEMALVFMNMGVFFLIVLLVLAVHFGSGLVPAQPGQGFYLSLVPALGASLVLIRMGWKVTRYPCLLKESGSRIIFPAAMFLLTVLAGMFLAGSWAMALAVLCFGLTGLAGTGFLAYAWKQYFQEVCV